MDTIIKRSKWSRKRVITLIAVIVAVVLLGTLIVKSNNINVSVDYSKIKTAKVEYGDFQEIVVFNGTVEPLITTLIDVEEGGIVESLYAEDGAFVEAGKVLMRLNNKAVALDFMQRETQMVEQINNLRNTRIALDQNQRSTEDQLMENEHQLKLSNQEHLANVALFDSKAISNQEFFQSKTKNEYLKDKVETLRQRLSEDLKYLKIQITRIDHSILLMERNLEIVRANLKNQVVRAPISGLLSSFNFDIGQSIAKGQTAGRIDKLDEFIISAQVDQHYLNRVSIGQVAKVVSGNQQFITSVSKVLPTVVNGQFEINLAFQDSTIDNLRRGQSFQIFLELSAQRKSTMIHKGSFYQSSGGSYVFVISDNGESAVKRDIELGTKNQDYYEVISGLSEGETVITSSYEAFKNVNKISISN